MQRTTPDGLTISCDFCGTDWDAYDEAQQNPMTEGHHGSVICLSCTKQGLEEAAPATADFKCTLGLTDHDKGETAWQHPNPTPSEGLNPHAITHWDNLRQAGRGFGNDADVDYEWPVGKYPRVWKAGSVKPQMDTDEHR